MNGSRGFTIVECLLAMVIGLAVMAAFLDAALDLRRVAAAQVASADAVQRARGTLTALARELELAGASVGNGPVLADRIPVIWPKWIGPVGEDAEVSAYADRISMLSLEGRDFVSLAASSSGATSPLDFVPTAHCPSSDQRCGFTSRSLALVVDALGRFDVFRVTDAAPGRVVPAAAGPRHAYDPAYDVRLAPLGLSQYAFDRTRRQIRWSNGFAASVPVVDDVVAFEVQYFGDSRAPLAPRPPPGASNCLYDEAGAHRDALAAAAAPVLAEIPLRQFVDGPFCGGSPSRFDMDLLRVRVVRVRVRTQAAEGALRGQDARFTVHGWGRGGATVPDVEWSVDVTPLNIR